MRLPHLLLAVAFGTALLACTDEAAAPPPAAGVVEAECLHDSECGELEECRGGRCVIPGSAGGAGGGQGGAGGVGGRGGSGGAVVERCGNGIDDDGDGQIDCADGACVEAPGCTGGGGAGGQGGVGGGGGSAPVEDCDNLQDDDRDGRVDCLDTDCQGTPACSAAGGAGGGGGAGGAGGVGGAGGLGGSGGCALPLTYYIDLDTDGWGTNVSVVACAQPAQTALQAGDCDDTRGFVHPGATDDVGDGIDADCNGSELCFADADGDGHVPVGGGIVASPNLTCGDAGEAPPGAPQDDCDDGRFYVNPGWPELCDGVDNDCDGNSDGGGVCMTGCAPSGTLHDAATKKSYQSCDADELYSDAETNCASIGTHLVRVDSAAENLKVQNLCNVLGTDCWLGATDRAVEGTWTWPDGQVLYPSQPGIYTAFGSSQPQSGGLLDCLAINAFNGTWRVWDCSTPMEYVCEFP